MKSAKEVQEYRRQCMRECIGVSILNNAKEGYLGYTTSTHDCPSWLRAELIELGYEVSLFGTNSNMVQILFGEKERD